jgi:type II secretory pathway component PulF
MRAGEDVDEVDVDEERDLFRFSRRWGRISSRLVSLSSREKQIFFTQLAQLIRSGVPLPSAAQKLGKMSNSDIRAAARRLHKLLESDRTTSEAFEAMGPHLEPLERTTLAALARTGRLDFGLDRLAEYFGTISRAQMEMLSQSAYPLVILHLGILLLNVQILVGPGGLQAYIRATATVFLVLYGAAGVLAVIIPVLHTLGAKSGLIDGMLRLAPFFGRARRALATSRFCGTFDLQLDAGVNVIESLNSAAAASRSGLIYDMADWGTRRLRKGKSLAEALGSVRGALPAAALDRIIIAEETGELHRALPILRQEYEEEGLRRLRTAALWLPKILYFGILVYLGWRIISFYLDYFKQIDKVLNMNGTE